MCVKVSVMMVHFWELPAYMDVSKAPHSTSQLLQAKWQQHHTSWICPLGYFNDFTSDPSHVLLLMFTGNALKHLYRRSAAANHSSTCETRLCLFIYGCVPVLRSRSKDKGGSVNSSSTVYYHLSEGLCILTDLQYRAVATLHLHGCRLFCLCRGAFLTRTRSDSGTSVPRPFGSEIWSCSGTARTGTWTPFKLK